MSVESAIGTVQQPSLVAVDVLCVCSAACMSARASGSALARLVVSASSALRL